MCNSITLTIDELKGSIEDAEEEEEEQEEDESKVTQYKKGFIFLLL